MPSLPIDVDTHRIVFGGHTGNSAQTWSSGFTVYNGAGAAPTQAQLDSYAAAIQTIVDGRMGTLASRWDPSTTYSTFKVTYYRAGILLPSMVSTPPPGGATGSGTRTLPGFCALVCSLRTPNPMRTGRGRMYIPATAITVTSDGETDDTTVTAFATNMANMLTSVSALVPAYAGGFTHAAVASHKTGTVAQITHVICDSKIDVQHRRTDKQGADFSHSTNV